MKRLVAGMVIAGACVALIPGVASARPPYRQAFLKTYDVKAGSALEKSGCNLCHQGANKQVRNPYGKDLEKALGKANASEAETVAALKKIEGMPSQDKKTKYVDLIKADKLPGEAK